MLGKYSTAYACWKSLNFYLVQTAAPPTLYFFLPELFCCVSVDQKFLRLGTILASDNNGLKCATGYTFTNHIRIQN